MVKLAYIPIFRSDASVHLRRPKNKKIHEQSNNQSIFKSDLVLSLEIREEIAKSTGVLDTF
jgi:hypothetical protein